MKNIVTILFLFLVAGSGVYAQVGINSDNSDPQPSAMLDVKSESQGLLPPRMTMAQINLIPAPAEGLMVYNTSLHSMVYFNGTRWERTDGKFYVGESHGGGIIFYLDNTGDHGLISATSDQGDAHWGCGGISIPGTSTDFGTGQANTTAIINGCFEPGIAARICDDLVLNTYSDWFLPSQDELYQLYLQKTVVGGFANGFYWSSSEANANSTWIVYFDGGMQVYANKSNNYHVRPVRAF